MPFLRCTYAVRVVYCVKNNQSCERKQKLNWANFVPHIDNSKVSCTNT